MQIRIISIPPGEAPEEVRKAWIGLVLPVPDKYANVDAAPVAGVLSGPKTFFGIILARFRGQIKREPGYVVAADTAVEILNQHAPDAATWWRQNAGRTIAPGKHFVFARDVCEVIREELTAQ
jgi:hypothetical protein